MATLDSLRKALRWKALATLSPTEQLSDSHYLRGFSILTRGSTAYQEFIIPQLAKLVPLVGSDSPISVLEIGPGPKSVLGYLPDNLRNKVGRYSAFEPNKLFVTLLEDWFTESPLPRLGSPPEIQPLSFDLNSATHGVGKFDLIVFCHSMYGMTPKRPYVERALEMLADKGLVVVFHRENLDFDGLVCQQTASFPTGVTRVLNDDKSLDSFAPFIAGFDMPHAPTLPPEWRKTCRGSGASEGDHLLFSSPEIMVAFNQHASALPRLTAMVPSTKNKAVKNREASVHRTAAVMTPTNIQHVRQCVEWAREHKLGLTVIGGGHSGHCIQPNVVSVDMSAFDKLHILKGEGLAVAEAGCKAGDIIQKTMEQGLTVPLGSRPSVGAGLWLQGGIGHLARLHGLACDAIVGAVMISVDSDKVLCIGNVPDQHRPVDAVRHEDEEDLLWALKGAGTNFGIVISVTFMTHAAPTYLVRNWMPSLAVDVDAQVHLGNLNSFANVLPGECSVDGYLFYQDNKLHLGVTRFETAQVPDLPDFNALFGEEIDSKPMDGVELFDSEMYMSKMHGGHGGGKTSSFKRCFFLKSVGDWKTADILVDAIKNRPSPLCYLHLLHGGGAIGGLTDTTAFGCRDWMFACVVTAVWPRDQDGTGTAREAVKWVYDVAEKLLPLSAGVYGADLGPDPRDKALAAWAFGPNRSRLAHLKRHLDLGNVLAYACPLLDIPKQKLIILVTGESGSGKDHCAGIWASVLSMGALRARVVSISDETKSEYAAATNTDLNLLLSNRSFKERCQPALTRFFKEQVKQRPELPKEHFLKVVNNNTDVDVLIITGMRDEAALATYSHLLATSSQEKNSRLIEVRVQASKETRQARRGCQDDSDSSNAETAATFTFNNDTTGVEAVKSFARCHLLTFFHEDLERLASIVPTISDYPTPGVDFRHVLNTASSPNGLSLCTSLLKTHFAGDWAKVDVIACCEAGGFLLASPLAEQLDKPLVLIRKADKLPPPVVSVSKSSSHVSSLALNCSAERIEMNPDLVSNDVSVVVVDDVLASGKTLCAVLRLLCKAGARVEGISVMIVAELPYHGGREFLRDQGFGAVNIQSLLVFGGA